LWVWASSLVVGRRAAVGHNIAHWTCAVVALGGAADTTGRVGTFVETRKGQKENHLRLEVGTHLGLNYTPRLYVRSTLWRMENNTFSYFVSKIFDFLEPLPPTPPDALDLAVCYGSVIALACTSIYCGSIGSLPYHQQHKHKDEKGGNVDSDDEDVIMEEKITTDDAWLLPIFGSCILFGLYLLLRYLGPEWVNEILRYWFAIMSWGAVFKVHPLLICNTFKVLII
jgi:hypothetical protein